MTRNTTVYLLECVQILGYDNSRWPVIVFDDLDIANKHAIAAEEYAENVRKAFLMNDIAPTVWWCGWNNDENPYDPYGRIFSPTIPIRYTVTPIAAQFA